MITSYEHLMDDKDLTDFLFSKEFKSREVPYSKKLTSFVNSLPSLSQISIDKDTLNAYTKLLFNNTGKVDEARLGIELKINRKDVEDSL